MKKNYTVDHSIRGDFHVINLTKTVRGMPGFAPEWKELRVARVVVQFRAEAPYVQFDDQCPSLGVHDLKEILELLERGYVESDFQKEEISE